MRRSVYIDKRPYALDPSDIIGQGGEAVVYAIAGDRALKIYHEPDNPLFAGNRLAQRAARQRLDEHQQKLKAFPQAAPANLVAPEALAYDVHDKTRVVGYSMRHLAGLEVLLRYSDRKFREAGGIDANLVVRSFLQLHQLVGDIHDAGIIIGDFNDLNVLVTHDGEPFAVDADSMKFGPFECRTFTTRFVDPLHCAADKLELIVPHSQTSDWYAFATMLFQSLLYINPYGGVHRPQSGKRQRDAARILNRVTVFSSEVVYPKAALPFSVLPDDLLHYFNQLYEQDERGVFPSALLKSLRWTTCSSCNATHARARCPSCAKPGAVMQTVTIRGNITATRKFQTDGRILFATVQDGVLRYVYHRNGAYCRETNQEIWRGQLDSELRIRIQGDRTIFAKNRSIVALSPVAERKFLRTQSVGRLPIVAANSRFLYWIEGDNLVRNAEFSPHIIGRILSNRTLVWAGEKFGFGFYQAGALTRGFVFDAERSGLNDSVPLPPMAGHLIDATCVFGSRTAWFMATVQESGALKHRCFVVNDRAELLASVEADQDDESWLGAGIRGHFADGNHLYVATDQGITRVTHDGGQITPDRVYADTEPFVTTDTQLLPSREGILAVSGTEIVLLQFRQP